MDKLLSSSWEAQQALRRMQVELEKHAPLGSYTDYDIIMDFLLQQADNQADIESKNMLRKARDAASERALKYAAKAGELELENAALKIRLEQEGVEV